MNTVYSFKPDGDANFYRILTQTGDKENWFARVQLNGEMTVYQQKGHMQKIIDTLNETEPPRFTRIKNDVNGNSRHVTSWLGYGFKSYAEAIAAANKIGGRKYNNKSFGGGLVFQCQDCEFPGIVAALETAAKS